MTDLVALLVVVPLIGSIVALFAGLVRAESGWGIAVIVSLLQAGCLVLVGLQVIEGGEVSYVVGGFRVPYGIELVVSSLSVAIVGLIVSVTLGMLAFARVAGPRGNSFFATLLLLVGGLTGVSITGDVFNMYVFLEITGIAAYTLVASGDRAEAAVAAYKYLLLGTVGASMFLLGIGYAYIVTGTLNMSDLAEKLAAVGHTSTVVQVAFVLMVTGLFIKVAVFPVHTWLPDAYVTAPDSVSGFISALVSTVAAFALLRVMYRVFTVEFIVANAFVQEIMMVVAVLSIVVGSGFAVAQSEVKRMLAYSSVAQFGIVIGAFSLANSTALFGGVVHLIGHGIMKGGLFLAVGLIASSTGARVVYEYDGLIREFPVGAGSLGVLAFAIIGVPPTIGFMGKWYIALGAVETGSWLLALVIVGSTLLTLGYFASVVERMFFRDTQRSNEKHAVVGDGGGEVVSRQSSVGMISGVVITAVVAGILGPLVVEFRSVIEPAIAQLLT